MLDTRGPVPTDPTPPGVPGAALGLTHLKLPSGSNAAMLSRGPLPGSKLFGSCRKGFTPGTRPTRQPCANDPITWQLPDRTHINVPREKRKMGLICHPPTTALTTPP